MGAMIVRRERPNDKDSITSVHDGAFLGSGESRLVSLLRESDAFVPKLSLVAELDGQIVGHVLFSKIILREDERDLKSLSLAPVAVLPAHQKRGIGNALISKGLELARELGFRSVLVLGDPAYYGRFGFRHDLVKNIECRYFCEQFAGLELEPGALSKISAAIAKYPAAFTSVD